MLNIEKMIYSAQEALGWPYVSPGSNDKNGIDCSGLFVKIYRDQGAKIAHGSNTIYRQYCTNDKGPIIQPSQLKPGMAIFKHKDQDTEKYPDGLGDFCHIGLVISGNPLRIIHASSDAGCVTTDTKIGKWKYYGKLSDVDYGGSVPESSTKRLLRSGCKGDDVKELQKALNDAGYDCGKVDGIFGTNTRNALVAFQMASGVNPDGICGPQTWAALANSNAATYTVTIEGVTWGQYMKIRELCPLAEAKKER